MPIIRKKGWLPKKEYLAKLDGDRDRDTPIRSHSPKVSAKRRRPLVVNPLRSGPIGRPHLSTSACANVRNTPCRISEENLRSTVFLAHQFLTSPSLDNCLFIWLSRFCDRTDDAGASWGAR